MLSLIDTVHQLLKFKTMKKTILIIAILLVSLSGFAQEKKYVTYTDSLDAYTKIAQINKVASVLKWKDGITNNYCYPIWNNTHTICAIPIEQGYENYFTIKERSEAIELNETWKSKQQ